jgi:hypothetical protein
MPQCDSTEFATYGGDEEVCFLFCRRCTCVRFAIISEAVVVVVVVVVVSVLCLLVIDSAAAQGRMREKGNAHNVLFITWK